MYCFLTALFLKLCYIFKYITILSLFMITRRFFVKNFFLGMSLLAFPKLVFSQQYNLILLQGVIQSFPKRILSAGRVSDVLLISLCPEKLVGISTEMKQLDKQYLSDRVRNLPYIGRLAGRGSTMPIEKILATQADLIVDTGTVNQTFISTAQKVYQQTQIPYLIVSGKLMDTSQQFKQLGDLLGVSERAEKLANFAERILTKTHNLGAYKSIKFYLARGIDGLETALQGAIHTEAIDWVGGINVTSSAGEKLLTRISMEQLFHWQPDIILTQDINFYHKIQSDELWQKLSAVQNNRVYLVPSSPFGWLDSPPSINRLLGCAWLAHILVPEKFSRKELEDITVEYFQLFYGYELSAQHFTALLTNI